MMRQAYHCAAQRLPLAPLSLCIAFALCAVFALSGAFDQYAALAHAADDQRAIAAAMRSAGAALIKSTPEPDKARLVFPFDDTLRADWHYTPRTRAGIALKDMSAAQRTAARALLEAPLSTTGIVKVQDVMALEAVLRDTESFTSAMRVPENYAIAIYGVPGADTAWGWRIEGHHLSLHFTVDDERVASTTPHFVGANPIAVTRAVPGGPPAGRRLFGAHEAAARALLASFTPAQRMQAVISDKPYGDILSRNLATATPLERVGLPYASMSASQQKALVALIEQFAAQLKPALARDRMAAVRASGAETIQFAWAGSDRAGTGHYFRIQGERFLIEYDNSGGNHVHSVWRDFAGDWGRDVLGEHYRRTHGTTHKH